MTEIEYTPGPLLDAARNTSTALWNDSSDLDELRQSISYGGVGATCNPVIAYTTISKHLDQWRPRIKAIADAHPTWGESEIGWQAVKDMSVEAAKLLEPIFDEHKGRNGRLSVQTDPRLHRDAKALADQAEEFHRLARNIVVKIPATRTGLEALRAQLEGIFERFNDRWPDPNRGTAVSSYPEYAEILDGIIHHGLSERRQVFKQHFQQWSGNDLKLLGDAFEEALEDIHDRLDPVNDILRDLPFGASGDRLRITVRQLHPQALTVFRRELRQLSSNVEDDWDDERTDERFTRLRAFVMSLAESDGASRRDDLLDVRRHIEVTASKVDSEGRVLSTYASLGGKSGGESQELVSFIVGAALRYQLGDETRTKPRFAPVLLDEGFIKADGEFAFRAVRAWRGLGFQLIIGAPLDKVTALEPHCDLILAVTKNDATGYSYVQPLQEVEEELPSVE